MNENFDDCYIDEDLDDINSIEAASPDFRTELAKQLAEIAPEAIADGKVDFEKLKELLGDDVSTTPERFGLFWPGKREAIRIAQTPTTATLKPDFENSVDWDTTENVFIEGDNLEVLKILQRHYYGKIKMIYIDPPYNTGKDFVYRDDYRDSVKQYLEWTKQLDLEGHKQSSNLQTDGRYHSNWLNMMYPRLKLARNLLTQDGVIFVSIDDNEQANLKLTCDSIFGEENFIEHYFWESSFRPDNSSNVERENAQHILCYARNKKSINSLVGVQKKSEGLPSLTKNSMKESVLSLQPEWVDFLLDDGFYESGLKTSGYELLDAVRIEKGKAQAPFRLKGRVIWSQSYLEDQIKKDTKIVIKSEGFVPYSRKKETSRLAPTTLIPKEEVGDVLAGNADIRALFKSVPFTHPKPISLLQYLIKSVSDQSDPIIILDFFAGSSSTAHAALKLNAETGRRNKFVMVQLPEVPSEESVAFRTGFRSIAEVSRQRIKLAGVKLTADFAKEIEKREDPLDIGFRAYKLIDTNFVRWHAASNITEETLQEQLLAIHGSADDAASIDDLLTEMLLKQGFSLTEKISDVEISGLPLKAIHESSGGVALLAYLDQHRAPTIEQLREVIATKPTSFIILEDCFGGSDELKTNLAQMCKTNNVELWTA